MYNLTGIFNNPWSSEGDLISLSTGLVATPGLREDLQKARVKGQAAMKSFVTSCCLLHPTANFFDPLKKNKLKSFLCLKTVTKVRAKDLLLPLQMDQALFSQAAVLGQSGTLT